MAELNHVPMELIDEPSLPSREAMDEDALRELSDSMAQIGLQQPIVLVARGARWEIVAGHRRYMAARRLGWRQIMALCHQPGQIQEVAAQFAENYHRAALNAAEEARWFAELVEKFNLDEAGLCKLINRSPDYVGDRWRLLQGDPNVLEALRGGKISFAVARELNKCDDIDTRRMYLYQAEASGCASRVVAQWVSNWRASQMPAPSAPVDGTEPAPAPQSPTFEICCALCGGNRDPYNLIDIKIHRFEWERIQQVMREVDQQLPGGGGD